LANSDTAIGVVDQLAEEALRLMLAEQADENLVSHDTPATSAPAKLDDFPGYYASEFFGLIQVSKKQGHLNVLINAQNYPLTLNADNELILSFPSFGDVKLSRAELSKRQVLIADMPTRKLLLGEKISPKVLTAIWKKRLGKYQVLNRGKDSSAPKTIRLSLSKGFLTLSAEGLPATRVLMPVSNSEAIIVGLGRSLGDTLSFENQGGKVVMKYSGFVAQQL